VTGGGEVLGSAGSIPEAAWHPGRASLCRHLPCCLPSQCRQPWSQAGAEPNAMPGLGTASYK